MSDNSIWQYVIAVPWFLGLGVAFIALCDVACDVWQTRKRRKELKKREAQAMQRYESWRPA